ncbi:MAG: hypothetical protein KC572_01405 [Gammaproteobacteria bacterium]|nr:hypothetical protein [Gammaproteobacteria bacterium]
MADLLRIDRAWNEAEQHYLTALELDPYNPGSHSVAAHAYAINGQLDKARKHAESAWELGHPTTLYQVLEYLIIGRAFEEARQLLNGNPDFFDSEDLDHFEAFIAATEDPTKAGEFLARGVEGASNFWFALEHFRLGRLDKGAARLPAISP